MNRQWLWVALMLTAAPAVQAQHEARDGDRDSGSQWERNSVSDGGEIEIIEVDPLEAPQPMAPPEPTGPAQLEEVVVTAQKKQQSLQDVPVSVTALDGDFIQDVNAADLAEVATYVPNVRVDADDLGSPQLFIRGFGTNAFNPSFESSVAFVQDEIYFGRPGYFTESMFDIERVEVLRGPQGTLFGKNTVAGVFNVTSRGPGEYLEADARYTYGEDNAHRVEAGIGDAFGSWGGGRAATLYRREDGQLYNQFLERDEQELEQKAARVKLRFYPSDSVSSELLLQASDTEANFWPFQLKALDSDTRMYLQAFDPQIEDDPYDFNTSFDTAGYIEKGSETVGLNTKWSVGDLGVVHNSELVLVLAGSKFSIDQLNELDVSPADIARLDNHEDHEQLSAELRFSGSSASLFGLGRGVDFVAGTYFYRSSYTLLARIMAGADLGSYALSCDALQLISGSGGICAGPGPGLPPIPILGDIVDGLIGEDYYQLDYDQDVDSLAFFGQATWWITDRWALTPGLRFTREDKQVDSLGTGYCRLSGLGLCVMPLLLGAEDYDRRGLSRDESDASPKFTIQYFSDYDVNLYASYARGYKSGGFNALSYTGEDLEFEPEDATTYEFGLKATLFDRRLRINAALYETHFDNLQVLAFNGLFFDVSNAAAATSRGLETDLMWLTPYAPLQIMGSVGLLEAEYEDYDGAPAPIRDEAGNLQLDATQDLSGKRIAFAPDVTAAITPMLSYNIAELTLQIAGDIIYTGEQYTDTDLDPETRVDAYTKYGARMTLSNLVQSWSLTLGCNNLTDERVLNQVTDATFFPGTYFAQQADGRQLYASFTLRY